MTSNAPLILDATCARKASDGRVSVVDVIACVTGKSSKYAGDVYNRLVAEERIPRVDSLPLAARSLMSTNPSNQTTHRGGMRARQTQVATAAQMVEIIWQLPGAVAFRRNCAKVCVRYLGGDPTLVDEITANRAAQERLAATDPTNAARMFGEAVEAELPKQETARRLRLQNDELETRVLMGARQALIDAGHTLDASQEWSFRDRIANLMRPTEAAAPQTVHAGQFLADRMPASEARKWRSRFGSIAARMKRVADGLLPGADLPRDLKNVDGNPTPVVVYRWPEEQSLLEGAFAELTAVVAESSAVAGSRRSRFR